MIRTLPLLLLAVAIAACAGRSPQLVAMVQPHDRYSTCEQIMLEIQANNEQIEALAREQGQKAAQNVVAGAAGLFIPVLWLGMDWQGTAGKEAQALSQRNQYLGTLAHDRCAEPAVS